MLLALGSNGAKSRAVDRSRKTEEGSAEEQIGGG
jgi:hypothetical protein